VTCKTKITEQKTGEYNVLARIYWEQPRVGSTNGLD